MNKMPSHFRVPAGNDLLWIPFSLNVRDADSETLEKIIRAATDSIGAVYFRDKPLFMEVLEDKRTEAGKKFTFLYGPYVSISIKQNGDLRLSVSDEVAPGSTVYAHDQFFDLCSLISPADVAQAMKRATPDSDPSPSP